MLLSWVGSVLLGVLLGMLAGLLGTGGGTFAIPALVLALGYEQKLAQGTALVMVVTNVLKALLRYRSLSGLDVRFAAILAASGTASSALSSHWALSLSGEVLQTFYGVFLIALAGFVAMTKGRNTDAESTRPLSWKWAALPGLVGGVSLGLFGVGGAMLAVPLLALYFGQTQVRAQGLGLALALPGCAVTLVQYGLHQHVDWVTGSLLAIGGLFGVGSGVKLAHSLAAQTLTRVFCGLLVVGGLSMLAGH